MHFSCIPTQAKELPATMRNMHCCVEQSESGLAVSGWDLFAHLKMCKYHTSGPETQHHPSSRTVTHPGNYHPVMERIWEPVVSSLEAKRDCPSRCSPSLSHFALSLYVLLTHSPCLSEPERAECLEDKGSVWVEMQVLEKWRLQRSGSKDCLSVFSGKTWCKGDSWRW